MLVDDHEPTNQPSARAVTHWRIVDGLGLTLIFALVTGIATYWNNELLGRFDISVASVLAIAAAAFALAIAWFVGLLPWLGVRYYRFELTDNALYIQKGPLTRERTVIPYARVQSVMTRSGPLERRLGLTSLVLVTAAHAHKIQMLDAEIADELRDRVCSLAREAYDDL